MAFFVRRLVFPTLLLLGSASVGWTQSPSNGYSVPPLPPAPAPAGDGFSHSYQQPNVQTCTPGNQSCTPSYQPQPTGLLYRNPPQCKVPCRDVPQSYGPPASHNPPERNPPPADNPRTPPARVVVPRTVMIPRTVSVPTTQMVPRMIMVPQTVMVQKQVFDRKTVYQSLSGADVSSANFSFNAPSLNVSANPDFAAALRLVSAAAAGNQRSASQGAPSSNKECCTELETRLKNLEDKMELLNKLVQKHEKQLNP